MVLKKLNLNGITNNDILSLYVQLRNDGYLWYDTKTENIGKDEEGNLLDAARHPRQIVRINCDKKIDKNSLMRVNLLDWQNALFVVSLLALLI